MCIRDSHWNFHSHLRCIGQRRRFWWHSHRHRQYSHRHSPSWEFGKATGTATQHTTTCFPQSNYEHGLDNLAPALAGTCALQRRRAIGGARIPERTIQPPMAIRASIARHICGTWPHWSRYFSSTHHHFSSPIQSLYYEENLISIYRPWPVCFIFRTRWI